MKAITTTLTPTGMTTATEAALPAPVGLLPLMWLASPALPIGGFSYSEGLEAAVDAGTVHDEASAGHWLVDQLHLGQARSDLAVLADALAACRCADWAALQTLDDWVRQTRESAELRQQTEQMGRSLVEWLKTLQGPTWAAWNVPPALRAPTYPVAYAMALACLTPTDTPMASALSACAFGWCENMVQAAVKAVPLGQSAGQRILARLVAECPIAIDTALSTPAVERQAYTPMLAILSARHETQYSRLFRS